MKTFTKRRGDLAGDLVRNLCLIKDTSKVLPHIVFIEEQSDDGEPEYNKYQLVEIRKDGGCSVVDCNGIRINDRFQLREINVDWLLTVWNRHIEQLVDSGTWREDAIEFLGDHTEAGHEAIVAFCDNHWRKHLPYTDNLKVFDKKLKR